MLLEPPSLNEIDSKAVPAASLTARGIQMFITNDTDLNFDECITTSVLQR